MFSWLSKNPNAAAAMKRVIILKYLFVANLATPPIEMLREAMSQWSVEEAAAFTVQLEQLREPAIKSLKDSGLWRDVEESERTFLQADIMEISQQQRIDAGWLAESIACLLWALQIIPELPPYDQEASHELVKALPAVFIKELVERARLLSKQDIEKQRSLAELWHWRSRTRSLQESGRVDGLPEGYTFERIIAISAAKAAENGDIPEPIGSDFPALGKPYRDLSPDEFSSLTSIAQERHKALNWLCGRSPSGKWADTPTDT